MTQPIGGIGETSSPSSSPSRTVTAPRPGAFADRLLDGILAQDRKPEDPRLEQVRRAAARSLESEVTDVRLVERYDDLSADEGLYEILSAKGAYQVVRSRLGAVTLYPS